MTCIGIHPNRHNGNGEASVRHAIEKTLIDILHYANTKNNTTALILCGLGLTLILYHIIQFLIYHYWSKADRVLSKLVIICGKTSLTKSITILQKSNFHKYSSISTIDEQCYEVLRIDEKVILSKFTKNQEK